MAGTRLVLGRAFGPTRAPAMTMRGAEPSMSQTSAAWYESHARRGEGAFRVAEALEFCIVGQLPATSIAG